MPSIVIIDPDPAAAWVTKAGIEQSVEGAQSQITIIATTQWPLPGDQSPEVVIIDPAQDILRSVRLIQRLREASPTTRMIVLTSAAPPGLRAILLALGVDVYLEKATALPQLLKQLNSALDANDQSANPVKQPQTSMRSDPCPSTI